MLPGWLRALRVMLHEVWSTRRDAHIRFLKLQVEMLKGRLPGNRVILDPVGRRRLMKTPPFFSQTIERKALQPDDLRSDIEGRLGHVSDLDAAPQSDIGAHRLRS